MNSSILLLQILLTLANNPSTAIQEKYADVKNVQVSGSEGRYTFLVTLSSPDKGCHQYADWWEVVSEDGALIYRRILLHSHVNEQPFTRSGRQVKIKEDQVVWVRAHMNNSVYGGVVMKGSVNDGFNMAEWSNDFGEGLDEKSPLPTGCNF